MFKYQLLGGKFFLYEHHIDKIYTDMNDIDRYKQICVCLYLLIFLQFIWSDRGPYLCISVHICSYLCIYCYICSYMCILDSTQVWLSKATGQTVHAVQLGRGCQCLRWITRYKRDVAWSSRSYGMVCGPDHGPGVDVKEEAARSQLAIPVTGAMLIACCLSVPHCVGNSPR